MEKAKRKVRAITDSLTLLLSKVNFTLLSKNIYFSHSSLQYYKVGLIILSHRDVTCEALCALAVGLDKEV